MDEFLLASFPLPSSSTAAPSVSAVAYPSQPKQDGRLCVATPHSGIALYDVSQREGFQLPTENLAELVSELRKATDDEQQLFKKVAFAEPQMMEQNSCGIM